MRAVSIWCAVLWGLMATCASGEPAARLRVGITLHPYYSWVASVVGTAPVDVVPVLPADADSHGYQASPADLKLIGTLDAIVVNGLGHDDFVKPMIEASGNTRLKIIDPSTTIPLIPYARGKSHTHAGETNTAPPKAVAYNPHTFLALTTAIQQVYAIQAELAALQPASAALFRANAQAYAKRLRKLKADALARLAKAPLKQVATVHDGYCYLLQELGLELVAVIEPAHGVEPSASELAGTIDAIKAAGVKVVFSELSFPKKLVDMIAHESGARVYTFDHMSTGEYSAPQFENAMKANLDVLVGALGGK